MVRKYDIHIQRVASQLTMTSDPFFHFLSLDFRFFYAFMGGWHLITFFLRPLHWSNSPPFHSPASKASFFFFGGGGWNESHTNSTEIQESNFITLLRSSATDCPFDRTTETVYRMNDYEQWLRSIPLFSSSPPTRPRCIIIEQVVSIATDLYISQCHQLILISLAVGGVSVAKL